jgi:hypothetical protein
MTSPRGGAAKVWLSARTPPNLLLRTGPGGLPGDFLGVTLLRFPVRLADAVTRVGQRQDFGELAGYGLPIPGEGVFARLRRLEVSPSIIDREVVEAIKAGRIEIVGGVQALDSTGVRLADATRLEPDAVICATGFRAALEPLVGHLGVLDARGIPRVPATVQRLPGRASWASWSARPGFTTSARRAGGRRGRSRASCETPRQERPSASRGGRPARARACTVALQRPAPVACHLPRRRYSAIVREREGHVRAGQQVPDR